MNLNRNGQLILPILAILFLFGLFWIPYVLWCQDMYWTMRMSAAADLVAVSGAREQARLLNNMASLQTLQNTLVPQVKGAGGAGLQVKSQFDVLNAVLQISELSFKARVYAVLFEVARLNGRDLPLAPGLGSSLHENLSSRLTGKSLTVTYVAPGVPPVIQKYAPGYFARSWSPKIMKAQPSHRSSWVVCRGKICSEGRAALWLDVQSDSLLHNGGFPPENASWLRSVGFQCFYPQFNARLLTKR